MKIDPKPIVEKVSVKEPDIRSKFRNMLTKISEGKWKGILAWHPDRLACNMKDAGENMVGVTILLSFARSGWLKLRLISPLTLSRIELHTGVLSLPGTN